MKNLILLLIMFVFIQSINSQTDSSQINSQTTELSFDLSLMYWNDEDISDTWGSMTLIGIGLAKKISDGFKVASEIDFGKDEDEGTDLQYTKFEVGIRYAWSNFNYEKPTVYGGLGILGVWIKADDSEDYTEKGDALGFSAILGIIIPLSENVNLDIKWNSVWSEMEIDDDNFNVGSQIFSGGLTFKF